MTDDMTTDATAQTAQTAGAEGTAGAAEVLRTVWGAGGASTAELDESLPTAKVCRNMKDVTFDGFAEPGSDLRQAWRELLEREGKLSTTGGSIRDIVLGADTSR